MQFPVGIYHEKFQHEKNSKWPTCGHFRSSNFLVNVIHSTIFYVSLQNLYQISFSLIARMSLKLGKIRTETRSWRPKWLIIGHHFCNMRNIWKTGPDSWTITIEQNVQFQVGIYPENYNMIKLKMADLRPLPIVKFSH